LPLLSSFSLPEITSVVCSAVVETVC